LLDVAMNHSLKLSLLALALAGCSGASQQLVDVAPGDPSTGDEDASTPAAGNGSSSGGGGGSSSGSSSGASSSGGNGGSSGGAPAPAQCPSDGTQQTSGTGETQSSAMQFDTIACGTLSAGQSYWWTFELPGSTSKFGLAFPGGIQIALTVNGTTMDVTPGTVIPFHRNTPYYVQVAPIGSVAVSYVLVVTEQ
jgi:hypothetical protein